MTTETLTLTDFLLARIAEDEVAVRMPPPSAARWREMQDRKERHLGLTLTFACPTCHVSTGETCIAMTPPSHAPRPADGLHGTRQDLARASARATGAVDKALAECEAKRRIMDDVSGYCFEVNKPCGKCERVGCRVLRILALPYADHPDYDEEWRG